MPLVEILFQGRCVDQQYQEELAADLCQLDSLGDSQVAVGDRVRGIAYPGVEVHPNVLISAAVFEGERPPRKLEKIDGAVFLAEETVVFGHEVSLLEPLSQKVNIHRAPNGKLGLVFLRSRNPILDGRLVSPCGINPQHPFSRLSEWILEPPSILLNGGLGAWSEEFLVWVKEVYIPDLRIWMSEELHSTETAEVSSWRKWMDKESQFTALKQAYHLLSGVSAKRAEETWEMDSLFKDEGQKGYWIRMQGDTGGNSRH